MRTIDTGLSSASAARTARHAVYAGSMLLAPILLLASTPLNPAVGGIGAGALNIAANMAADPVSNQLHIALYEVETFLLPLGMLGMAGLLLPRSPWMATVAGGLGLMGWLPWSALTAQDDLTFQMAQLGGGPQFVELWNRFTTDGIMGSLTLIYVISHLLAFVMLGVGLGRARVIPAWAAWALALTSPLTVIAFATRQHALLMVVALLWLAGSVPAGAAVWRNRREDAS
jgi:hypothetical protein